MTRNEFIPFAIACNVLKFGDFTLKSGRKSPYFFNAGLFNRATQLAKLGQFYAQVIIDSKIEFDVLFGPAYKGIPIASATAVALANLGVDCDVCFDRKEVKAHGEKGALIGASLANKRVLLIDDVITQGTAFKHASNLITKEGGKISGLTLALDRKEKNSSGDTAINDIAKSYQIPVLCIASIDDLIEYLGEKGHTNQQQLIIDYLSEFGG